MASPARASLGWLTNMSRAICCLTTTCARPGTLAAAAVISASPFPTAVTNPESSILATDCLDEVQVMVNPLIGLPAASLATAESWRGWPKAVSVVAAGLTSTTATRGGPTPPSPPQGQDAAGNPIDRKSTRL